MKYLLLLLLVSCVEVVAPANTIKSDRIEVHNDLTRLVVTEVCLGGIMYYVGDDRRVRGGPVLTPKIIPGKLMGSSFVTGYYESCE